ncbi:MAG: fasciclin domain-containing protein [Xanthomonadales bacterium]|nr:fasciclin domain-containing protein [Xanthomonadales bacterium]
MRKLKVVLASALLAFSLNANARPVAENNIADVAAANGNFGVLLLAVSLYPDIERTLTRKGQYTVFAPTDAAFGNLAAVLPALCFNDGLVAYVLDNPGYIKDVLLYHVAKGSRDAAEVLPADQVRTLNGEFITREPFSLELDNPFGVGEATTIVLPNVFASNGVVHAIDQVLLPSPPPSYCL